MDDGERRDGREVLSTPGLVEQVLETSPVGIAVMDAEGRIRFVNERGEEIYGRSRDEVEGLPHDAAQWDLVDEDGDPLASERTPFSRVMNDGEPVDDQVIGLRDAAGDRVWISVNGAPHRDGDRDLAVFAFADVTDRVRQHRRLQDRERAIHGAYEIIADPDREFPDKLDGLLDLVRSTLGTDYATLSRVHEEANEYIFDAVATPADADLEAGDTTALDATNCEHAVRTRQTLVLEDVDEDAPDLADRAGNADWGISCYLGTPVTVGEEVYGTFCFYGMEPRNEEFSDWQVTFVELLGQWVSYELERERRRRELEASNERLEGFAYAVSHDLQEPLRMVTSYLQLLDRRYGDRLDDDAAEFIAFAMDGAERMREMIDGLLEYARVETRGDPLEPVDLDAVVDDTLQDLEVCIRDADAEVTVEELPTVVGDRSQLRQVFQNLLDNAVEYGGEGTTHVRVSAERDCGEWVVSVTDDGIGIDPDDHDRVFEVFQRLHTAEEHEGTGIGLALCDRIVDRHGGDIWIDSEPGEGTTVSFPLSGAAPSSRDR